MSFILFPLNDYQSCPVFSVTTFLLSSNKKIFFQIKNPIILTNIDSKIEKADIPANIEAKKGNLKKGKLKRES